MEVNLVIATKDQVNTWFESRPELEEMLIQDMRKKLGIHFLKEFKYVFNHTGFLVHPTVGIIPDYSIKDLGEPIGQLVNGPDFESCGYDDECNRYIYKRLWFLVWVKENYGEIETGFDEPARYEVLTNQFSAETEKYFSDLDDYFYGWKNRQFSNGKSFQTIEEIKDLDISSLRDSEIVEGTMPGGDVDIYATVLESTEGRIFVRISGISGNHLMEVASNVEAEKILNEIWV
jgi:hypothetical protein